MMKIKIFLSKKVFNCHPSLLISNASIAIRTKKLRNATMIKKATLYKRVNKSKKILVKT